MATNIGQDGTGAYGPVFTDLDMDDVGIWRRVLTSQEVAAIYSAGLAGKDLSTAQVTPPVAQTLTIKFVGSTLQLSWTANATLQAADTITGPWNPVTGTSPLTVIPTGTMKFYRTVK